MHEKCPYSEFFWSVFSSNWTEYGLENSEYGHLLRSDSSVDTPSLNKQTAANLGICSDMQGKRQNRVQAVDIPYTFICVLLLKSDRVMV